MHVTSTATARYAPREDAPTSVRKLGAVAVLAALGDFLLFGHSPGLGGGLFAAAVEAAAVVASGARLRPAAICALVGAATLAPLVEDANLLSIAIAIFGAGAVALIANGGARGDFAEQCLRVLMFVAIGPFNALIDLPDKAPRALHAGLGGRALIGWVLPIGLGGIFLALFSAANPVIEGWLSDIDLKPLLAVLDLRRIAFWLLLVAVVWPFAFYRAAAQPSPAGAAENASNRAASPFFSTVFGKAAISRALVLFNAMFAVQTALDVAILGRGHSLPAGISFAAYAHRGAYPLVATALLAGAFVVLAMRAGSQAARSTPIRALVYLWIAQNVALVVSSLYRLDLYVRVYSLTYWRVAAFIWMALVAIGLILVIVQISTRRTNRWLLSANAAAMAAALYLAAFVDFDYLIANYNLHHCGEVSRQSVDPDRSYLDSLGPGAISAIDAALAAPGSPFVNGSLSKVRTALASRRQALDSDWRSWTLRAWRLAQSSAPA
jgi:hypothetical protein